MFKINIRQNINGTLEFIANGGGTFYNTQYRTYLKEICLFFYDMWHGVYHLIQLKKLEEHCLTIVI